VPELVRIARVEADIDPRNTRIAQSSCMLAQPAGVCRDRQFVQAVAKKLPDVPCNIDSTATGKRLAASQPDSFNSTRDKGACQRTDLFMAEDFRSRKEFHCFGHAVTAAHVATIG